MVDVELSWLVHMLVDFELVLLKILAQHHMIFIQGGRLEEMFGKVFW